MKFSTGAGGFAAASLLLLLGIFNPTPSHAWAMNASSAPTSAPVPIVADPEATDLLPATAAPPSPVAEAAPEAAQLKTIDAPRRSLAQAVEAYLQDVTADAEQDCLATAVYFEAKGEPLRGQLAVAQVILNRTHSGRFASSICGVVKQRGQFSFVHGGHLPSAPHGSAAWHRAVAVARLAREGTSERPAADALFFHARSVSTGWHAVRVAQIGNHLFYR